MKTLRKIPFHLLLLLVLGYTLAPFLWQGITSLKPDHLVTALPPLLPESPLFTHYRAIFREHPFGRIIVNSLVVSSLSTLFGLAIASPAAFSLAKLPVRFKGLFLAIVLSTSMFPPIAIVSPLYLMIRSAGLRDTWWGLILAYTTFALPLAIWILTTFFQEIPDELYKAARVDGCTVLQAFCRILLPIAAPGFFTAAILVFLFCWNEFLFALTFTTTEASRTIPVGIALFPGLHEVPFADMAAASVTVTLPIVLLAFLFQKRIVAGLTAGAVKG
ncbi:MAG: carbohydrate ABC transporter permease [Nitrospiria bacterium]